MWTKMVHNQEKKWRPISIYLSQGLSHSPSCLKWPLWHCHQASSSRCCSAACIHGQDRQNVCWHCCDEPQLRQWLCHPPCPWWGDWGASHTFTQLWLPPTLFLVNAKGHFTDLTTGELLNSTLCSATLFHCHSDHKCFSASCNFFGGELLELTDAVHLFHDEYPSAWDYPDPSYTALELAMWRRKVFLLYSLTGGGIQIQKIKFKNASIIFFLYMQINRTHAALNVSIQARSW